MGILETILGVIGGGATTAGASVAVAWIRKRKAAVESAAGVAKAREEGAAAVVPGLLEEFGKLRSEVRAEREHCDKKIDALEVKRAAERKADREACDREIKREVAREVEPLREALARVSDRTAETRREVREVRRTVSVQDLPPIGSADDAREDTGLHELQEISERLTGPGLRRPQRGGDDG